MTSRFILKLTAAAVLLGSFHQVFGEVLRSGFPLMMEITDSRLLALGGAALTEAGKMGVMAQNPASIFGGDRCVSASYARHPVDIWSGKLSGGGKIGDFTAGGFLQTYGYGSFKESVSGFGATGRTFDASENLLGLVIAGNLFQHGSWGIAGKIDWFNIDGERSAAGAIDAGMTYDPKWEKFKLGLSFRNWGSEIGGKSGVETPTPRELSLSASKRLQHLPLTLYTVVHLRRKGEGDWNVDFLPGEPGMAFGAGGEFEIMPADAQKPFNLRFGYRSFGQGIRVGNSSDTFAGFSFGLGLFIRQLTFDYAFAPLGALGRVHRLGVSRTL